MILIAVGACCTDERANDLLVVSGFFVPYVNSACCYIVCHMCLQLMVMDKVDQPMSVALRCCIHN